MLGVPRGFRMSSMIGYNVSSYCNNMAQFDSFCHFTMYIKNVPQEGLKNVPKKAQNIA